MNAAIVVGCNSYEDNDLADLKFASADAAELEGALHRWCGVDRTNIFTLSDAKQEKDRTPTRAMLIRVLSRGAQISASHSIDTLFFCFSGHGQHSHVSGNDYLLLKDTVLSAVDETALAFDTVLRYLRQWSARRIVLFLDACRADPAAGKAVADSPLQPTRLNREGVATFFSCSPGERSYEDPGLGKGVFTAALVRALGDQGRCTTPYEINEFLAEDLPALGRTQGLPEQHVYTVIEPIGLQGSTIVSPERLREINLNHAIGREIRETRLPATRAPRTSDDFIAIDFGTSSSAVSALDRRSRQTSLLKYEDSVLIPSAVRFMESLDYCVGKQALRALDAEPDNIVAHVKRRLGSGVAQNVFGRSIYPEAAAALIIGSLKRTAEDNLGYRVTSVLASYPVNFPTRQIEALVDAYGRSGFETIRLMSEPAAAALVAAKQDLTAERFTLMLVIDLGGGTLDIATVEVGHGVVDTLATGGDASLGGLDYDDALAGCLLEKLSAAYPGCNLDPRIVRAEAERTKILLSRGEQAPVYLGTYSSPEGEDFDVIIEISREEAAKAFASFDEHIVTLVRDVLARTDRNISKELGAVLLTGQGTKTFSLARRLRVEFPDIPFVTEFEDTAVARGLAVYLGVLVGTERDRLLLDVVPRGYGMYCERLAVDPATGRESQPVFAANEPDNSLAAITISRDTTIPTTTTYKCHFSTASEGGTVTIFEVEPGSGTFQNIMLLQVAPDPAPDLGFDINMDIDLFGTLVVTISFRDQRRQEHFQANFLHHVPRGYRTGTVGDNAKRRVTVAGGRRLMKLRQGKPRQVNINELMGREH